ncbi:BMC domain-containing protein [Roseospira marina]|uniref:BMC domain-containing protein n=1 Tax=Roseospira marina TaxID=140057 RepID=A0A5M6IGQ0_9PROT|nr:BMC domain-containing protein [Roseospira marina]KAA5607067.1 BMC domain-containing protein [Roseospira marina]MBB4312742.1 ethanolamine utilization microcompartment shell protein EutL [Roseospira marina]MBB5086485.1 ethanolamine utilization microcompartment shell protein EutL [Roseospira marina]
MNARIINAPGPDVMHMLGRRIHPDMRATVKEQTFGAVGLVQASVADLYFFADVAQKAADVLVVELFGSCPQHVTTLAFFGETSAVRTAMQAIERA